MRSGIASLRSVGLASIVLLATLLAPWGVRAQSADAARAHYERGIALYDEGQFTAALAEFEAAYEGSHRASILFNIGQIHARLGRAVEAVDTLQRYLTEAGSGLSAERRGQVESEIATQRSRIATLAVTVSVPGATVALDDLEVGTAPLSAPLRLSAGEHVVSARAEGFETARYRFRIAGGAQQDVSLELVPRGETSARLRIEVDVPGADVRIDGRAVGLTPIELPVGLPAGVRRVEVTRAGYEPIERDVSVAAGAEATLTLDMQRLASPPPNVLTHVELALPTTSYTIRIDGDLLSSASVDVPYGLHDLSIEAADMEPIARRIEVPQGPTFTLDPEYRWTAQGRQARRAGAESQRTNGVAILLVGAGLVAGGTGLLIGREIYGGQRQLSRRREINGNCEPMNPGTPDEIPAVWDPDTCDETVSLGDFPEEEYDQQFNIATNSILDVYEGVGVAGFVLLGAGAATMIGGLVVFLLAPSDEQIDAGTTLRVSLGVSPGGLSLRGTF